MALDYQGLLAWTIKAVTELNSKVDTLEQENITLRARITNLEGN
jgi:cell division protein FtsB